MSSNFIHVAERRPHTSRGQRRPPPIWAGEAASPGWTRRRSATTRASGLAPAVPSRPGQQLPALWRRRTSIACFLLQRIPAGWGVAALSEAEAASSLGPPTRAAPTCRFALMALVNGPVYWPSTGRSTSFTPYTPRSKSYRDSLITWPMGMRSVPIQYMRGVISCIVGKRRGAGPNFRRMIMACPFR